MEFKYRGLDGAGEWRIGEYRSGIEYQGLTGPGIYVKNKGVYFIEDIDSIGICSGSIDKDQKEIYSGDVLENESGMRFEVRFGTYSMYCPVDNCMMENYGFYTVAEGIYEDMPLGPTAKYARIIGNVTEHPELRVDERYRCQAEPRGGNIHGDAAIQGGNVLYDNIALVEYEEMTFQDFVEVCDRLELPVFEVELVINPFGKPHKYMHTKTYQKMSEYRKKMPEWSARNYNYEQDHAEEFYVIKDIPTGDFSVRADNNHADYYWHFKVLEGCVVVHSRFRFTD